MPGEHAAIATSSGMEAGVTLGSADPRVPKAMPGERVPRSADVAVAGVVAAVPRAPGVEGARGHHARATSPALHDHGRRAGSLKDTGRSGKHRHTALLEARHTTAPHLGIRGGALSCRRRVTRPPGGISDRRVKGRSLGTVRVMVIIGGGWGSRRRGYGPFGAGGYRRRYGGGGSCMRDVCLVESGCCLAEMLGCGPQLGLLGPSIVLRAVRGGVKRDRTGTGLTGQTRGVLVAGIRMYQQEISPRRAQPCCRYTPTCSTYALQALDAHGLRRGLRLAAGRLLRCRPGSIGGVDWVPAVFPPLLPGTEEVSGRC
jgi:putative membrane protein insertion efficiency factor